MSEIGSWSRRSQSSTYPDKSSSGRGTSSEVTPKLEGSVLTPKLEGSSGVTPKLEAEVTPKLEGSSVLTPKLEFSSWN